MKQAFLPLHLWSIKIMAREARIIVSEISRCLYLHPATAAVIPKHLDKRGPIARISSMEDLCMVDVASTGRGQVLVR